MKQKKITLLCLALAAAVIFVGCSAKIKTETAGNLLNFDLGSGSLTDSGGRKIPYEIQGVLGIPQEKNCPVVVLIHGAHPIEKASESRYDTGFDYLTHALSQQGNLVLSMNVAINYSFEDGEPFGNERTRQILTQQLELLKKAVAGDKKVFDRDLTGLGNFEKVVLVGHSRGGLDVLECRDSLPQGMQLAGLVAIAPAEYKVLETRVPGVPVGFIIPQMDGDVISLDGGNLYEELMLEPGFTGEAELVYLKNANHAYFNTQLTQPDLNHLEEDLKKLIQPEKQRDFLVGYLIDFVKSAVSKGKTVFSETPELQSMAYGCDVLLRHASPSDTLLWSAEEGAAPICTGAVTAAKEIDSKLPAKKTIQSFRMPELSSEEYALRHVIWESAGAEVMIPLSTGLGDHRFLQIDLAVDSTDLKNKAGQSMTLSFVDAEGKTAQYEAGAETAALLWQEGQLVPRAGWDGETTLEYSTYTPLVTLRIDRNRLAGVDLSRLTAIKMSWGNPVGSMMLRSISAAG